jgi:hypothetical protein
MAPQYRVSSVQNAPPPEAPEGSLPAALAAPAHAYLARLSALHDEAAETAHLANLLGRAPWIAGVLGIASLVTALASMGATVSASLAVWLVLMAAAVGAIGRRYAQALAAPFDLAQLIGFVNSFSAMLLYAGAAWGAGLFLAVPAHIGLAGAIAFTAVVSALVAAILRACDLTLSFVAPATAMGAFCVAMRDANIAAALGILAGGLLVAAAAMLIERIALPKAREANGR